MRENPILEELDGHTTETDLTALYSNTKTFQKSHATLLGEIVDARFDAANF